MTDVLDAPPVARRSKRRWVAAAGALVVVAAASIGIGVFIHWRDNPNLFLSFGNSGGFNNLAPGHTAVLSPGVYTKADRTVDIRSVTLVMRANTAKATVAVVLCEKNPGGENIWGGGLIELRAACARVTSFHPGTYRLQFDSTDQLYVEVTPHQAGTVRIEGVRVRYNDGMRRGDQVTGLEMYTISR